MRDGRVCIVDGMTRETLFSANDEREFKRQYAIQFLASHDVVNYNDNCNRGWKGHCPLVEDACYLAESAWRKWVEVIGVRLCASPDAHTDSQTELRVTDESQRNDI